MSTDRYFLRPNQVAVQFPKDYGDDLFRQMMEIMFPTTTFRMYGEYHQAIHTEPERKTYQEMLWAAAWRPIINHYPVRRKYLSWSELLKSD